MPKISVVIATYNRCRSLKDTLDSLLNQEYDGSFDYEVIVADNNSNDETKEAVESYKPQFNGRLGYLFEPKQGKSYALNTGIKEAKGEIVAFTDDDCVADKNWLKNIKNIFKNKDVDILGGKVTPFFTTPIPEWLQNYEKSILRYPLMLYDLGNKYLENDENKILPLGSNISLKKTSFSRFGDFSHAGRAQDIEFCNKWHKLGAKIAYSPAVVVHHYTNPARMTKSYFRKYFFQTGKDHVRIFREKYLQGRCFSGVPLWLFKELLLKILRFIKGAVILDRNIFLNELLMWHTFGIILGLKRFKVGFDNLR